MATAVDGSELWEVLRPLRAERERIERILARLQETEDLVERADLASELVRSASRYEDTLERSVDRAMEDERASAGEAQVLEADQAQDREELRRLMTVIHERTMHVDPRNVHAPDPQGFEDTLAEVADRLPARLADEDRHLSAFVARLSPEQRRALADRVAAALRNASERPRPPRTAVGRAIANAHVKLDHTLEDVSTPRHPGADTIKG